MLHVLCNDCYITSCAVISGLQAAEAGAKATVSMKAKAGRASYVHTSRLMNPDPGAQAVALWMEAVYSSMKK